MAIELLNKKGNTTGTPGHRTGTNKMTKQMVEAWIQKGKALVKINKP